MVVVVVDRGLPKPKESHRLHKKDKKPSLSDLYSERSSAKSK